MKGKVVGLSVQRSWSDIEDFLAIHGQKRDKTRMGQEKINKKRKLSFVEGKVELVMV